MYIPNIKHIAKNSGDISESKLQEYDGLIEFYPVLRRIVLFFVAIFYKLFGGRNALEPAVKKPRTIAQIEQEYSEKYLSRFLAFVSQSACFKNGNISATIQDANALAEILKDPNNEVEKEWRKRILIEPTPRGNVYMYYDVYKRAFSYYCDQAVMPYKVINSVAMKYVMIFRCCDFFIDSTVLPKKEAVLTAPNTSENESSTIVEKKGHSNEAFAKFKTYNVAAKKAEIKKEEEKTINGFLHLGQVRNWSIIEKPKRTNPLNGFKTDLVPSNAKLSYKDYKSMNK